MQLNSDFGKLRTKIFDIARKRIAMVPSMMKSYQKTLFGDAAAPTKQQRVTNAPRAPFSEALISFLSRRIRSLNKTIFIPLTIFLVFTTLVVPVAAMDNQTAPAPYPVPNTYGISTANPPPGLPIQILLASLGMMAFIATGYVVTMANQMLGPLMGVTSVLSLILRNDKAVWPSFSWAIFGIWSIATMMYLRCQTRRVKLDSLYILITLMFAGLCLCVVALVQKGSIPGGLVTAIPPCTSFAAYFVGFLFPDRGQPLQESAV